MHILSSVVPSISPRSSPPAGTDETFSRMSSNISGEKNNLIYIGIEDHGTLYHVNFTALIATIIILEPFYSGHLGTNQSVLIRGVASFQGELRLMSCY